MKALLLTALTLAAINAAHAAPQPVQAKIERGRYLITVMGCNDCHTKGYGEANGKLPESAWLMGSDVGYAGPWGTTYAVNLRPYFSGMTEAQWLAAAKAMKTRPPMPWFNLKALTDADLRAVHAYMQSLGNKGSATPKALPPGQKPPEPVIRFPGAP